MSDRCCLNQFLNGLNQNRSLRKALYPVEMNRDFWVVGCESSRNSMARLNQYVSFFLSSRKPGEARLSGIQNRWRIWIPARRFAAPGMTDGWMS